MSSEQSVQDALGHYFEASDDPRDVEVVARLSGGWSVNTFHVRLGGEDLVLRVAAEDHPLQTNAAREARIIERAATAGVPVPDVVRSEDDPRWLAAPFSLVRLVAGNAPNVWSRRSMHELLARVSAEDLLSRTIDLALKIQAIPVDHTMELASTIGLQAHAYDIAGDVERWRAFLSAATRKRAGLEAGGRWLADNAPPDGQVVFQHHDFRLGNMLIGAHGETCALLDWEFAGAGDPQCDIGYAAQPYCLGKLLSSRAAFELRPDPTSWMLNQYVERSQDTVDPDRLRYFVALGIFKMAVALAIPADRWWQGSDDTHDAWLELPILSLTEDLIGVMKEMP